ncbi:hypothetical protein [Pseudoalteromonas xiamenensis]|uniref:Phage abortive infection protein n=1 Tax=Pseudoalteromonas xiamenensis TaxID=882626 RepID=A0A975HMN4_9GAMM|nr:hypothetical protein [Pseudoalteromonas xiamenensis]QTH73182.1 hypothetical protein J5O05_20510 [Pseudoalteromonas xiamenensis]
MNRNLKEYVGFVFRFFFFLTLPLCVIFGFAEFITGLSNEPYKSPSLPYTQAVFQLCAAITALFGLFYRSLQTEEQLKKMDKQISIAEKKENFILYLEHKKQLNASLNYYMNDYLKVSKDRKWLEASYDIDMLYMLCYPDNTPQNSSYFSSRAREPHLNNTFSDITEQISKSLAEYDLNSCSGEFFDTFQILYCSIGLNISLIDLTRDKRDVQFATSELMDYVCGYNGFLVSIGLIDAPYSKKIESIMLEFGVSQIQGERVKLF